jgi:hypothetical protein
VVPVPAAERFDDRERAFLLRQRGIAEGVLAGLEAMSIRSIHAMVGMGADELCRRMGAVHGRGVWANRRRALRSAIEVAIDAGLADPDGPSIETRSQPGVHQSLRTGTHLDPHARP